MWARTWVRKPGRALDLAGENDSYDVPDGAAAAGVEGKAGERKGQ